MTSVEAVFTKYDDGWPLSHYLVPLLVTFYLPSHETAGSRMWQTFQYLLPLIVSWELLEQGVLANINSFWSEPLYDTWIGDMFMGIMGWFASVLISPEHRTFHFSGFLHVFVFVVTQTSFYMAFDFEYMEMWGIAERGIVQIRICLNFARV